MCNLSMVSVHLFSHSCYIMLKETSILTTDILFKHRPMMFCNTQICMFSLIVFIECMYCRVVYETNGNIS